MNTVERLTFQPIVYWESSANGTAKCQILAVLDHSIRIQYSIQYKNIVLITQCITYM